MMRSALVAFAALAASLALAGERVPLWPEGRIPDYQEHQIAAMTSESEAPGFVAADHRMPYLEWYEPPAASNRNNGCMILISGGSYNCCCDVGLVKMWNEELTKLGFQCVNLVYRTPRPKNLPIFASAWADGQRAVRLVRSEAAKRGFDAEKIGAIGMSAGGHLTVMLATSSQTSAYAPIDAIDTIDCHLNLAVANAPAYATEGGMAGNAAPQDGTTVTNPKLNPCFKFDSRTCPISFHHGAKDPFTPNGSTLCYRELRKRKIPSELHLYAEKGHGAFGFPRAVEFMRQLGWLGKLEREEDLVHRIHPDGTLRTEKEYLWPTGKMPDPQAGQDYAPYLVWYVPEKLATKAIQVVLAGGGYSFCNYVGEAEPVAYYLNQKGVTVVCVKYRCPRPVKGAKHLSAWQDAQRALRMVRAEAPARGLDPDRIGTLGFSAGGHLTLMTATSSLTPAYAPVDDLDKTSCSVQWAVPTYPAYALTDGINQPNAKGGNLDDAVLVPEFAFDKATPPMCFLHGDADSWAAMNSVKGWERLRSMGLACQLHTFATRGHCFHIKSSPGTGSYNYLDLVWEFLSERGFMR